MSILESDMNELKKRITKILEKRDNNMQTFITDYNPNISARTLDSKRLGKQRVEALQIADCLLIKESRWKSHPAVKMWKGYESYLIKVYLVSIFLEWEKRGYKNTKCDIWWQKLYKKVKNTKIIYPKWITDDFIKSHRSNLIRKNENHYSHIFQNIPNNLEYIWPI
jgi:hypothetical protein